MTDEQLAALGDAVPLEEITDEFGTYCHVTINPDSQALVFDESKVDIASLEANGFTLDDAKAAQETAVRFVVEQTFDSSVLDIANPDIAGWYVENAGLLGAGVTFDSARAGYQIAFPALTAEPLNRDGTARASTIDLAVDSIEGFLGGTNKDVPTIRVKLNVSVTYPASDSNLLATYKANDKTQGRLVDDGSIRAAFPYLFDGLDDGFLSVEGAVYFAFQAQSNGGIDGWAYQTNLFLNGVDQFGMPFSN